MKKEWKKRLQKNIRHIQVNFRRTGFTLVGDEGRPWRIAIGVAAAVLAAVLVLLFGGAETQLMSTPEMKRVEERGVIRVGIRYDMPGLCGEEDGLEHELARRIAMRALPDGELENSLQFVEVNSMTAGVKLDDGTVDMVIAMMSAGMEPQYNFSQSYYSDKCILAVKSGTSSFALKNVTVGYIQSNRLRTTAEDSLLSAFMANNDALNITKAAYASYDDMMMALMRGEIGGAAMTQLNFDRCSEKYEIVPTSLSFDSVHYAVMCASDTTVFSELATIVISELRESGELEQLYKKYGLRF